MNFYFIYGLRMNTLIVAFISLVSEFAWCSVYTDSLGTNKMEKPFIKKLAKSCGPQRLDIGWTDKSIMSCAINCVNKYAVNCYSFMYRDVTGLCTPGGKLSPLQQTPTELEGDLYVLMSDDIYDGFSYYYSNTSTYNLAIYKYEVNYTQAMEACNCLDSSLIVVSTSDEWSLLAGLFSSAETDAWIGIDDIATYEWNGGSSSYEALLQESYPDNGCSKMSFMFMSVIVENCSQKYHFVCEKNLLAS